MPYVTRQDLIDRFGELELIQLTDRTNMPMSTIDDVKVNRAISDATGLADSYLAKVYKLPLISFPDVLTKMCADLAFYYLSRETADKDSAVTRAYTDAIKWFRDVSNGIILIDVGGETPAPAGGGAVKANASTRLFTRDSLRNF